MRIMNVLVGCALFAVVACSKPSSESDGKADPAGESHVAEQKLTTSSKPLEPTNDNAQPPVEQASTAVDPTREKARNSAMLRGLESALRNTPYSAIVQYTDVEVTPVVGKTGVRDGDRHVYRAKVLETIRGEKLPQLTYTAMVEVGDAPRLKKEPVIIALCKDESGYSWPGVGSEFAVTEETRNVVAQLGGTLSAEQTQFRDCE